jgi:hypothetical protein
MRLLVVLRQGATAVLDAFPPSPFDTLETCFRLLSTGPACHAVDGRQLGHGLPARRISLVELRALLQHPAATSDLQHAVLQELVRLATEQRGRWMVGVAGVLLPGLRRIAASVGSVDRQAAGQVEADLLELIRDAIDHRPSGAAQLAVGVLQFRRSQPASLRPMACSRPLRV